MQVALNRNAFAYAWRTKITLGQIIMLFLFLLFGLYI